LGNLKEYTVRSDPPASLNFCWMVSACTRVRCPGRDNRFFLRWDQCLG
jgi:hypothetical protein